jgi:hypothetical protein
VKIIIQRVILKNIGKRIMQNFNLKINKIENYNRNVDQISHANEFSDTTGGLSFNKGDNPKIVKNKDQMGEIPYQNPDKKNQNNKNKHKENKNQPTEKGSQKPRKNQDRENHEINANYKNNFSLTDSKKINVDGDLIANEHFQEILREQLKRQAEEHSIAIKRQFEEKIRIEKRKNFIRSIMVL